jgi:hypothetical protein
MILMLGCFLLLHAAAKRAVRHQAPAFVPMVVVIENEANAALGARHGSSGGHPRPAPQAGSEKYRQRWYSRAYHHQNVAAA